MFFACIQTYKDKKISFLFERDYPFKIMSPCKLFIALNMPGEQNILHYILEDYLLWIQMQSLTKFW